MNAGVMCRLDYFQDTVFLKTVENQSSVLAARNHREWMSDVYTIFDHLVVKA